MVGIEVPDFPRRVLLVDDEPIVLEVLTRALALQGIEVTAVTTAEQALALLNQEGFGCLLADKNLPGMDGVALIAEVRALQPHCACMVITAYASTSSAVQALRLGATDYLEKPFNDLDLVAEKVKVALENHRIGFERVRFLERLREFQAELEVKEDQVSRQRTEIEMFNEVLELRVAQATQDLRKERDELAARLGQGPSLREGEIVGAEMALMLLKDVQQRPGANVAPLRGVLQRVVRQLESHLRRLRADDPPPGLPPG